MTFRSRLRVRARLRSIVRRTWQSKPKPLILMYHRIADAPVDYWSLAVSPARFEEQLRVIRTTRHPFALSNFFDRLIAGTLPPHAVALTFDDGYADNLVTAKPLLEKADVAATVFLATGFINRSESFWWDELANLILCGSGPQCFDISVRGKSMRVDFANEPPAREDGTAPPSSLKRRSAALSMVWQAFRRLDDEERRSSMATLRSILGGRAYSAKSGPGDDQHRSARNGRGWHPDDRFSHRHSCCAARIAGNGLPS